MTLKEFVIRCMNAIMWLPFIITAFVVYAGFRTEEYAGALLFGAIGFILSVLLTGFYFLFSGMYDELVKIRKQLEK